ncbi:molecular chaperone GrpE [Devosia sp. UYZn731]|uniref:nucleotide exchange factor GrpE n=1 Tax=Devosia sp. UYZn731 TaxID=3156345 RepID=UPI0033958DF2
MPAHDQQQPAEPEVETGPAGYPKGDDLTSQLAEMRDRWMRSEAEIVNVRTRARRDVDDARNFGMQKFAIDMVEAAENLRRGLASLPPATSDEPTSLSGLRAGLVEIERGFLGMLERNGVKMEDPTGAVFTPDLHQAIGQREVSTQAAGTVAHTVSPIWTLNGRLLRPAVVLVASAPTEPLATEPRA